MSKKPFNLDDLTELIQMWGMDREIHKASPMNQMVKLMEEVGELASGLNKNDDYMIADGIGDIFVVLVMMSMQLRVDFKKCVEYSYNEIKNRKGKIVNGVFVKESDL